MRHPIAPGTKDAIKRLAGVDEFRPGRGGDNALDQSIDYRIGNAGEVLRTLGGGRLL